MKYLQKTIRKNNSNIIERCIFALFLLSLPVYLAAQSFDSLYYLEGHRVKTFCSNGSEKQAKIMAGYCDRVMEFYDTQITFEPSVTLLVLSPGDWNKYTSFPVYGMPHYNDSQTLIVASEDNDFWKSFIPPIDQLPGELAQQIRQTYTDEDGNLSMRSFFDLLAIHELGHAYHSQGGLEMQRKWMGELFANILLHTYIAENKPEMLPALSVFPKMVVSSTRKADLKYTSLNELEFNYSKISQEFPQNYGWYQCRWHMAAAKIYNEAGLDAFKNLWLILKTQGEILDDPSFADLLSQKVHQSVADVQLKWNE